MEEENVVCIGLEDQRDGSTAPKLLKKLEFESYLAGTFRDLIAYMLDSEADGLNIGYDDDEKVVVRNIERTIKESEKSIVDVSRAKVVIFSVKTRTSGMVEINEDGELSELEKQISSYEKDEIILEEEIEDKSFPKLSLGYIIRSRRAYDAETY